jgi:hypothetical protein
MAYGGMLRAYAVCCDCNWELERNNALAVGAKHSKKYGHEVHVEITYVHIFGRKEKLATPEKTGTGRNK